MSPDNKTEAEQMVDAFVDNSNLAVKETGVEKFNKNGEWMRISRK